MGSPPGQLACVYCGARHQRASEVRDCWARSAGEAADALADSPPPVPAGPVPAGPAPTAPGLAQSADGGQSDAADRLGRSAVVSPGQAPPAAWARCPRVCADDLDGLESAWRQRRRVVIELDGEPAGDEVETGPVWGLPPTFAFEGERLAHAMWANAHDARCAAPTWARSPAAVRLGARAGGPGDVVLGDGRAAFIDGGPLHWFGPIDGVAVVPALAVSAGSLAPFAANETSAELAPDQRSAVLHEGGSARIIAPAGSGKTRVLTERARHLLTAWNLPARSLTLVAFNKRAADEMRQRTPDLPDLQVRTLNALGLSIVTRSDRSTTIDEGQVRAILDTLVDLPRRANTDPAAAWIEALSWVRLGLASPRVVEGRYEGDVDGLPQVFERYRAVLADRGVVDFDEQVYRAIEILLTDPGARRAARASCRVLLVDEFQDLTPAHLLLIRLLAGPDGSVFGVGDDDQTIYGYSGASPRWLIDYAQLFDGAGAHALEVNYRCPPAVVAAARTVLTHNRQRVVKEIVAAPGRPDEPGALAVTDGTDPLRESVDRVTQLVEAGAAPAEVAVLTRVNASLAPVQVALVHAGVPVRPAVDLTYLSRGGVQAALAWLRLAVADFGRLEGRDVVAAARRPSRALSPKVLEWMGEQGDLAGLERLSRRLRDRDGDKVAGFVADLGLVQRAARRGTAAVLRAVRDQLGLDRAMELLEGARRRLDRSAQTDDLDALVALAGLHPEPATFEAWLRQSLGQPGSPDGVTLSTIHRVKGREWPHVVLHDVSDRLLPHRLASDVEEERRVFHVGLTRGSVSVTVVAGQPPSPFLAELTEPWKPGRYPVPSPGRAGGRGATGPTATSAAGRSQTARTPARSLEAQVVAAVGLELEFGGYQLTVERVDDDGVVGSVGRSSLTIAFGDQVVVEGARARLVPPPAPAEAVKRAREGLRQWRGALARAEGKPAYVYLHDKTLEELATAMPATLAALARVSGIGPAKLEAHGEALLAVVAAARGDV